MTVFTNPDGSPRYTFTHAELLRATHDELGLGEAELDAVVQACVHSGVWDVALDDDGKPVYTVVPAARTAP